MYWKNRAAEELQHCHPWQAPMWQFIADWYNDDPQLSGTTSGTTGNRKTIVLEKRKMLYSAAATGQFLGLQPGQSALLCLSCHFIAGKMMVVRAILHQMGLLVVEPSAKPLASLNTPVDLAAMVPLQVTDTLQSPAAGHLDLVRWLLVGGAALPQKMRNELDHHRCEAYATYGMTETLSHIALKRINGPDRSEWLRALPDVHVSTDARGCLVIDAPGLLETPLVTNDLAEVNPVDSAEFKILGRIDNVINTGGIKVVPEVLEASLEKLDIGNFFIGALPDPRLGEKIVLVIEGEEAGKQQLETEIAKVLEGAEKPKEICFVPAFVRTESGKIKRRETLKLIENTSTIAPGHQ